MDTFLPHTTQMFVRDAALQLLEQCLEGSAGAARVDLLVSLAWHLRQRNCARALALADEAQVALGHSGDVTEVSRMQRARLMLLRAEIQLLFARLDEAERLVQAAARSFTELGDDIGIGDCLWTEATIALDRGLLAKTIECLEKANVHYFRTDDFARCDMCVARHLTYDAFRDPVQTEAKLQTVFPDGVERDVAVQVWVSTAQANVAGLTDDLETCIQQFLAAYHAGIQCGQVRQALVAVTNAVEGFTKLGDLDAALQWGERALTLAHATNWVSSRCMALMQVGNVMRLLSRFEEARQHLEEALQVIRALPQSRNYELVLGGLGELELDMGQYPAALESFIALETRIQFHMEPDQVITAWRGQANALCFLGRLDEAHAKASAALGVAQEYANSEAQIQVLRVLAQIHQQPSAPPPDAMSGSSAALHYLSQAFEVADSIEGYTPSPELLQQMAVALANSGDYRAAYEKSQLAALVREKVHAEQVHKRALAVQINSQVQRAQSQADHHRQLANSLRETAHTLEILGTIGLEVTASLNSHAVFEALHRHVNELLHATSFAAYLIDAEQQALVTAFAREDGVDLPVSRIALDSPSSRFAQCVREMRELVFHLDPEETQGLLPGTVATRSLMYAPLLIGERVLGAMTIQSSRDHAYGERERSIFRSLCAYGAIALDNARAYAAAETAQARADQALVELRQTQVQLVEQNQALERLSVTDPLTGLNNRVRLDQTLREEHQRHSRHGSSFGLLMIDVDHFKSVNDNHGHQVGDLVLVSIARTIAQNVRTVDVVGRWGGEEFLVICREIGIDGVHLLANKLRLAVETTRIAVVGNKTVSIGGAIYQQGESLTDLLARADIAMYKAKAAGRNQVVSS